MAGVDGVAGGLGAGDPYWLTGLPPTCTSVLGSLEDACWEIHGECWDCVFAHGSAGEGGNLLTPVSHTGHQASGWTQVRCFLG